MAWCHVKNCILVSQPKDNHRFHDLLVSIKLLKETVLLLAPFSSFYSPILHCPTADITRITKLIQQNKRPDFNSIISLICILNSHRATRKCEGPAGQGRAVKCWVNTNFSLSVCK